MTALNYRTPASEKSRSPLIIYGEKEGQLPSSVVCAMLLDRGFSPYRACADMNFENPDGAWDNEPSPIVYERAGVVQW
jgi:hypothetical protein